MRNLIDSPNFRFRIVLCEYRIDAETSSVASGSPSRPPVVRVRGEVRVGVRLRVRVRVRISCC